MDQPTVKQISDDQATTPWRHPWNHTTPAEQDFAQSSTDIEHPASLTKIHQIPVEITVIIFYLAFGDPEMRIADLQRCSLVCRRWRNIAIGTPRFWLLDSSYKPEAWPIILQRNSIGPLDVRINHSSAANRSKLMDFAEILRLHAKRVSSLECNVPSQLPYIQYAISSMAFPHVIALKVVSMGDGFVPQRLDVGEDNIPPLRYLCLNGVVVSWTSPRLSGLESLSLANISTRAPTIQQLHHLLSSTSHLRSLSLYNWPDSNAEHPPQFVDFEVLSKVRLPLLQSINISRIFKRLNNQLPSILDLPALESIRWDGVDDMVSAHTLLGVMKPCLQKAAEMTTGWSSGRRRLTISWRAERQRQTSWTPSNLGPLIDVEIGEVDDGRALVDALKELAKETHKVTLDTDSMVILVSTNPQRTSM